MREDQALRPDMPELRNAAADRACVKITRGLIEEYINGLRRKQHPFDSRKTYRRALQLFCDSLPESMEVNGSTLLRWRKELLEKGYAARTINVSVSVVNSFLNWLGHREFQLTDRLELEESEPSDITRAEYLRLLRAAREQGKERAYLWIKLFAATGIQIQALRYVTVEAVTDGYTVLRSNGAEQEVRFPECLRSELLDYARRRGRRSGPLFLTRNGDPVGRTAVTGAIRKLCPEAGVPEERGNPRSLRRLYQNTSREIYCNLERLAEQAINTLLLATSHALGRERLALLLETICATGIRVSEVKYMTVEAVQAGRAEIALKGKLRTILLPGKLCRKLKKYAKAQKTASGEIFLTRSGKSLSRKQIWAEMKRLCRKAGVAPSKVFPHNLRHLFARTFYRVCRDIVKLADVLGHSSVETTRIYLISTGAEHAGILKKMSLIL